MPHVQDGSQGPEKNEQQGLLTAESSSLQPLLVMLTNRKLTGLVCLHSIL